MKDKRRKFRRIAGVTLSLATVVTMMLSPPEFRAGRRRSGGETREEQHEA